MVKNTGESRALIFALAVLAVGESGCTVPTATQKDSQLKIDSAPQTPGSPQSFGRYQLLAALSYSTRAPVACGTWFKTKRPSARPSLRPMSKTSIGGGAAAPNKFWPLKSTLSITRKTKKGSSSKIYRRLNAANLTSLCLPKALADPSKLRKQNPRDLRNRPRLDQQRFHPLP